MSFFTTRHWYGATMDLFLVVSRFFELVGLYLITRIRPFDILLTIVAGSGFFALVTPFHGISRFHVSVEYLFVLSTTVGIAAAHQSLRHHRASSTR